jgi:DNA-binding response OmpR family regulator
MRILLVEDMPQLRRTFGRLLRHHGFEVCEANDGLEALECLRRFHPQLVVTDLMMPGMDGVELIERLRAAPETAALPILAITADSTGQAETRARRAGALDILAKPFNMPVLLDRLQALTVSHD